MIPALNPGVKPGPIEPGNDWRTNAKMLQYSSFVHRVAVFSRDIFMSKNIKIFILYFLNKYRKNYRNRSAEIKCTLPINIVKIKPHLLALIVAFPCLSPLL